MAYHPTGMQALFPVYLSRMPEASEDRDAFDSSVAQNESNLNQDLELLFHKILELESAIAELSEGETNDH